MQREGIPMRFVRSIFVPEDDMCFQLYEAGCLDDVRDAARRAALPYGAVVQTVQLSSETVPTRDQSHSDPQKGS